MNLKSDEISIVLRVPFYEDGKESYNFQQYRNQKIGFKFLDKTIEFSISDFYPSKWTEWPELVISNDKLNSCIKKVNYIRIQLISIHMMKLFLLKMNFQI